MVGCPDIDDAEAMRDTVKPYGRHVLVCVGSTNWGAHLEERDDLLGRMARDVLACKGRVDPPPKLTASSTPPVGSGVDCVVLNDGVVYRGVDETAWARLLEEHLIGGRTVDALAPEPMGGHHALVCVNGARDARCGQCGPRVAAALRDACAAAGHDVTVHMTSHVGGHRFAGNVIMYPGGTWYGHVAPERVEALVTDHFGAPGVHAPLLRGRAP